MGVLVVAGQQSCTEWVSPLVENFHNIVVVVQSGEIKYMRRVNCSDWESCINVNNMVSLL